MGSLSRLPAIQGLRAFAVFLVVFFHFDLAFPNGFLGVDVFFVISGFVIARLIQSQLERGEFSFRRFYYARFLRLFPALAVTVVVTLTLSSMVSNTSAFEATWKTGVSALFGVSNITAQIVSNDYFAGSSKANSLLHTWSLGVEEQFYLVLPIFLVIIFRLFRNFLSVGASLATLSALASFAIFASSEFLQSTPILGAVTGYYSPVSRSWEFFAGVLTYFATKSQIRISTFASSTLLYLGLTLILASSVLPFDSLETPRWLPHLFTVLGTSFTIFSQKELASQNRFLASRIMTWLGDRSYSIYLWHWPMVTISSVLGLGTKTALSTWWLLTLLLALSALSYRLFEQVHKGKVLTRHLAVKQVSALGFVLAISLATYWLPGWLDPGGVEKNSQRSALPKIYDSGCHGELVVCLNAEIVNAFSESGQNVYLVGDSNAAHHYPGLSLATAELDLNLYSMTFRDCSGVDFEQFAIVEDKSLRHRCKPFHEYVWNQINEAPPGLVVLGFTLSRIEFWRQGDSATRADLAAALIEFEAWVLSNGHKLVVVEPIPYWVGRFAEFEPDLLPRRVPDVISVPNFSWKDILGPIESWPNLDFHEETKVFETHSMLCSEVRCDLFRDGVFRYRDATHISIEASKAMKFEWIQMLSSAN